LILLYGVGTIDGDSVPVVVFAADVAFVGVGGIPHIRDSVVLTKLSFGLLVSHIAVFCSGVNDDVILFPWPWAIPKFPNSVSATDNILVARIIVIDTMLRDAISKLTIAMFLFRHDSGKQIILKTLVNLVI
jgi:hypothetical protein